MIMIPVSFALAFGQPLVPELTSYHQQKKHKVVTKTIQLVIKLTLFITLPAVIGVSLLSDSVYILLYPITKELNILGGQLFKIGVWLGLFYALYSIFCSILQGLNLQKKGITYLFISIGIKYVANQLLVPLCGINGFIYSTILTYSIWIILSYLQIKKHAQILLKALIQDTIPILISCLVMTLTVILLKQRISTWNLSGKLYDLVELGICGVSGAAIYFLTNYLLNTLHKKMKKGILRH